MTLAQTIREQAREEGREQCREEGMRQAIRSLPEVRFETAPEGLLEGLPHVSEMPRLEALHRHAVRCPSQEAFAEAI